MTRRIDQMVAGFAEGDAISIEARLLEGVFRDLGFESDIFAPAERVATADQSGCRPLAEYAGSASDLAVYHCSIASQTEEVFLRSPARKILLYHNITPAEWFDGFDDRVAAELRRARANLARAAAAADAVWADSAFNAAELARLGVPGACVLPLPFPPARLALPPDPRVLEKFRRPMRNILFVGRIAPNKCVEELILAFAWYVKRADALSRLLIVGSDRSAPRYYAMLRMLAGELDLTNVCFELFASAAGLAAYYELADLFVCPSRHEGYCLPLLEAMDRGVPVLARDAGGMPEALGGAGVLFDAMAPPELAALMHRVLSDGALRDEILASQQARMADVRGRDLAGEIKDLLAPLAALPSG